MRKSKLFFLIQVVGAIITALFILGSFISFSFGMPDKGAEENGVACSDVATPIKVQNDALLIQCGFADGTAAITYICYIIFFVLEIAPIFIMMFLQKKRWTLVSFIFSLLVPIGLAAVVYFQSSDIAKAKGKCDELALSKSAECDQMLFISTPIVTSFGAAFGLVYPILMFYVRCLKGNFEKEEKQEIGDEMKEEKKRQKEEKKRQKEEEKKKKKEQKQQQNSAFAGSNDVQFGAQPSGYDNYAATQFTPQNNNTYNDDSGMIDFGAIAHDN